jgi:hypothetical protein
VIASPAKGISSIDNPEFNRGPWLEMTKTDYDTASYERRVVLALFLLQMRDLIRNISRRADEISLKGLPGTADQ